MTTPIRLACFWCDRDDFDETHTLQEATALGWKEIEHVQSYEQSVTTLADPGESPDWYSPGEWYTHLGTCPACAEPEKGGDQ